MKNSVNVRVIGYDLIRIIFINFNIAPLLRRSALGKDSNVRSNLQQNTNAFQAEDMDDETPGLLKWLYG